MKIFQITKSTPAFSTYTGCGKALLITYDDIPTQLIYLPDDLDETNCKFNIKQDLTVNAKVYIGMASCYEFVVEKELDI